MRNLFEAQLPSPNVSNEASTSDQPKYDQEIGSNAASRSGDILTENTACWCCPYTMDIDLLRKGLRASTIGSLLQNTLAFECTIACIQIHMFWYKVLAESLGTFILMYSTCAILAVTQLMGGEVGQLEYAATAALSIVLVVFSIGAISGAHVNPSVTIAFATFGQFPWSKVPLYILAQIVGSVLATCVGKSVYGIKSELMTTRPLQGSTGAFWAELFATLIIMFLASSLAYQAKYVGHLYGFVVGTAIGLAVLITRPVSGASMNPARSLGPAIVSWKFTDLWIYLTAPTIGAVGGAFLFHIIHLQRHPCCSNSSPSTTLLRQPLR